MGESGDVRLPIEEDALALLEGPRMREPLKQAVSDLGCRLTSWKLLRIHHRPGAGVSGIYEVRYENTDGTNDVAYFGATTAEVETPVNHFFELSPTVPRLGGRLGVSLWRHPSDPLLPGLSWACNAAAIAAEIFARPGAQAQLSTVSYRPLRRAVIRATLDESSAYLKVVRRGHAELLWRRHRLLADAGMPVPVPFREPINDVLALHEVTGRPLARELLENGAQLLDPASLVRTLRQIPATVMDLPARPSWAERAGDYALAAAAVLPEERDRIMHAAAQIVGLLPSTESGPLVPTHGDFYEANLLVSGAEITGVLDVDAVGPGLLIDDLACFIGHLAVLPSVDARYVLVPAAMDRFLAAFDAEVDPAGLRIRAAGVTLSLIAGAKHSGSAQWRTDALTRLEAAESLIASAVAAVRNSGSTGPLLTAEAAL